MNFVSSPIPTAPLHPPPSVDAPSQTEQQQFQMLRLHSPDEAFRAISLLMAADKGYATAPISVAPRLWNAVRQRQYWLLVAGSEPVGCVLWGEITTATLAQSVRERREPTAQQLLTQGDALFALALLAKTPALVTALWRRFVRQNAQRPVMAIRHFGRHASAPRFLLYLDGHACDDAKMAQWLRDHDASTDATQPAPELATTA